MHRRMNRPAGNRHSRTAAIPELMLLLVFSLAPGTTQAQVDYEITLVEAFSGSIPEVYLWDLNESGRACGTSTHESFYAGFVWDSETEKTIIPITWPGIIATALFTLLLAYNEFMLVRILTQSKWTLPVGIAQFTGSEDAGHLTLAAAASVSATIPIILVILIFQGQLVKGLAAGAVKG